ncbi:MAG: EAL domain-containing protein [Hyphomicrobiaceae bacterium]|nr:EAL domain-containing protein [Hyphomicrobiaceae bacterium]
MRKPAVLIVDDDPICRSIAARKLEAVADVEEAADGFDALAHLQTRTYDLAIIDLEMPLFDGFALMKAVRSHPTLKHMPMVVLTADETPNALELSLVAGATSFLVKPLNWKIFGPHIQHVLDLAFQAGHIAHHDMLTELPNRRYFNRRAQEALAALQGGKALAIHAIDLDGFKSVNDSLGHAAGDRLLRMVADRIRPQLRAEDVIARMGGDEFAILQPNVASEKDARGLAARLLEQFKEPFAVDHHSVFVGASVGIALAPEHSSEAEALLRCADQALYLAKASGRSGVRVFDPGVDAEHRARKVLQAGVATAVASHAFQVHYQPVFRVADSALTGFEALLRWNDPVHGCVSPAKFIPIAEESGVIAALSTWVLREACRQAERWPKPLRVAVNISPTFLKGVGLVEAIEIALGASGIDPQRLEIEITETGRICDSKAAVETLHRIRRLGVRIVSDDFGTGQSTLLELQAFPFDKIKIDKSFVQRSVHDRNSMSIIRAVASLATSMGITSTAEGVETDEQFQLVNSCGCDEVQGFLFAGAMSARQLPRFIARHTGSGSQQAASKPRRRKALAPT